jgi:hypothetical protein
MLSAGPLSCGGMMSSRGGVERSGLRPEHDGRRAQIREGGERAVSQAPG